MQCDLAHNLTQLTQLAGRTINRVVIPHEDFLTARTSYLLEHSPGEWIGCANPGIDGLSKYGLPSTSALRSFLHDGPVGSGSHHGYERTANRVTSGGKRNPMNVDGTPNGGA